MLKWFSIIIILLNIFINLYALNDPDLPKDPSKNISLNDSSIKAFPAEIICTGKSKQSGNIFLRVTDIVFTHQGKIFQVKIEEIKSIEFLEWREHADKKNTYIFYPSKVLLTTMNDQQFTIKGLAEFNKIDFAENEKKKYVYAYFYDFWEKGRWRNSNTNDKAYPTKNSIPGTLQKIVFIENNDSFNKFIKYLTR
jgi:hypothetical protein